MSLTDQMNALARIVAKSRVDVDFRSSLLQDPASVLRDGGVHVPDGLTIEFVPSGQDIPASTQDVTYVSVDVLERDPAVLTEEALNNVSAGAGRPCAAPAGQGVTIVGASTANCSCDMCYLGTREHI